MVKEVAADTLDEQRIGNFSFFLKRIGCEYLQDKEVLTQKDPWAYWTLEIYRKDIKGQGGLGMLASDTLEVAKKLGMPMIFVTPFYTREVHQSIEGFRQKTTTQNIFPLERGFEKIDTVPIYNRDFPQTNLDIYKKREGSVTVIAISEPNFGELYQGENNSDHRLYQEVALGFGGYKALQKIGVNPAMNQQLNEAPTVFSALARLDTHLKKQKDFSRALQDIRKKTIYTNHTIVQAVEAEFTSGQFERFVIPNIESEDLKSWLRNKIAGKDGRIKLSALAIELSGKRNAVSLIHAREASKTYRDYDGNQVNFEGVTNGIALDRWGDPHLLQVYRDRGVLDEFDLPADDYGERLDAIDWHKLEEIKIASRTRAHEYMKTRRNQYGQPVEIPEQAVLIEWKRRIAGYKRPDMIFEDPQKLARMLEEGDAHLVISGKTHPSDLPMQGRLTKMFEVIDKNPILKKRIHFIQDYDEDLAKVLSQGSDISINTPIVRDDQGNRVSTEACGTSWEKDILNNVLLISTDDGGVADLSVQAEQEGKNEGFNKPYLEVKGDRYADEVSSLYDQLQKGIGIVRGDEKGPFLKNQLKAYLPIIAGSRMETSYLKLGFPKGEDLLTFG